jgi:hypothetical protein
MCINAVVGGRHAGERDGKRVARVAASHSTNLLQLAHYKKPLPFESESAHI